MNLDELNENEDDIDEEDEKVFEAYRWVSCLLVVLVNITMFICAVVNCDQVFRNCVRDDRS